MCHFVATRDLAKLYGCKNGIKDINKAVNRNIDRFPNGFYFELTKKECEYISKFQTGTLNKIEDKEYLDKIISSV